MRILPAFVMSLALGLAALQSEAQAHIEQYFKVSDLADPAQLQNIVVKVESASDISVVEVTDLKLEIFQYEGNARDALLAPNAVDEPTKFSGFMVYFDVVASGKLYRDGAGICSQWADDRSLCGVECDGGHFEMSREISEGAYLLTLKLRTFPELFENHTRAAFNIGFCGEADAFYSLAPAAEAPAEITFSVPLYYLE